MSTAPTQKEIDWHKLQVEQLVEKLRHEAQQANHQVLIDACVLIAVVAAKQYPCCTRKAAIALVLASSHLQSHMQQSPLLYTPTSPTQH